MGVTPGTEIYISTQPELERQYHNLTPRQKVKVRQLLEQIAKSHIEDPGEWDLDDEQPVSLSITLGDVRLVRQLVR